MNVKIEPRIARQKRIFFFIFFSLAIFPEVIHTLTLEETLSDLDWNHMIGKEKQRVLHCRHHP